MPERVHRHQRREPDRVAEVVGVDAASQGRARRRFGGQEACLRLSAEHPAQEREGQPAEVGAAADTGDDDVGLLAGHGQLGDRLLSDHRLVQQHMVEHRPERVVGIRVLGCHLDGLGDRDAQRPRGVRALRAAGRGQIGGRAMHRRAPGLDHRPPVGLLVIARAHHPDLALEPEQPAGEGEGGTPLAGAGLGRELADAGRGVLVGLRDCGVRLVRAGRRAALVLVVDVGRGVEFAFESMGAIQRGWPPQLVRLPDRLGDLDLRRGGHLLLDQRHREQRTEILRAGRLLRARV
jgi:hypothetical protein